MYIINLLLLTTTFFAFHIMSYATDTISINQVLKEGDTLISSGGSFEMGFFSPGDSTNRYIGIWFRKEVTTVVWVANRETPLTNRPGSLKLIDPGVLVLEDEANVTVWSTNTSRTVTNPVAQLLDSGNLVVKDGNDDNSSNFLWQSFNHPTDTLLAGMKLGWNFVTDQDVYLSAWKSINDPARGDVTFRFDPTGYPELFMEKGGVKQYRSGPWNGLRFSGAQNLRKNPLYKYQFVLNMNEVYYEYELLNSSVISRLTLNPSDLLQRWTLVDNTRDWALYLTEPIDSCETYKLCGAYGTCAVSNSPNCGCLNRFVPRDQGAWGRADWSAGCIRRRALNCSKGDGFLKYSGIKLPETRHSLFNDSMTLKECRRLCSRNCSCMAYASLDIRNGGSGCLIWYGELIDIREVSGGQDIYMRMSSSEIDTDGKKRDILIICLSLVIGLVLLGVVFMLYAWRRKKINSQLQKTGSLGLGYVGNHSDERRSRDLELPLFDLHTITKATDNFSIDNKLGEGGFGSVYKGLLEEEQEIAVKRLSGSSFQGIDEFKNEVICIAKLQHRNLVKLLGCCIEGEENILVYEYLTNKSLDLILFDPVQSTLLDWCKRFHIIDGIARGLLYLHQDSRLRIIHRDLKASNVLLDSDMNPKISDFGLARIFGRNETGAKTSRVVGTYGYMSPEYAIDGLFSVKSDVFSFGVLVLEIVTGQRNRGFSHSDHHLNLLGHAWMLYSEGRSLELVDSYLASSHYLSEVTRSIHISLLCVQQRPEDRPTMSAVVTMLTSDVVLPHAKHPGFFTERNVINLETSVSSNAASSSNDMSITVMEGR